MSARWNLVVYCIALVWKTWSCVSSEPHAHFVEIDLSSSILTLSVMNWSTSTIGNKPLSIYMTLHRSSKNAINFLPTAMISFRDTNPFAKTCHYEIGHQPQVSFKNPSVLKISNLLRYPNKGCRVHHQTRLTFDIREGFEVQQPEALTPVDILAQVFIYVRKKLVYQQSAAVFVREFPVEAQDNVNPQGLNIITIIMSSIGFLCSIWVIRKVCIISKFMNL